MIINPRLAKNARLDFLDAERSNQLFIHKLGSSGGTLNFEGEKYICLHLGGKETRRDKSLFKTWSELKVKELLPKLYPKSKWSNANLNFRPKLTRN